MKKKPICRRWIDENQHACEELGAANRRQSNEDTTVNISRASWTKFVNTSIVQP
jgi:hypothetical protein